MNKKLIKFLFFAIIIMVNCMFSLCLKIFLGKMIDVTLSTMQTMHVVSNKRLMASIIGFIDVFIWFIVVKEALVTTNNSLLIPISYALGFAVGTIIGSKLSTLIIKPITSISIITNKSDLCKIITNYGFGGTIISSKGLKDKKDNFVILSQIEYKRLKEFKEIINKHDKNAFIIISESKNIVNGFI